MSEACRATQHCAYHGWCHRCDPRFADLMSEINVIIQGATDDPGAWGPLYTQIAKVLHGGGEAAMAAELAEARATNRRLNHRMQATEARWTAVERAVTDWEVDERGTYVPLRTLRAIARAVGRDFDDTRYVPHYERVEGLQAEVGRLRQLLEQHGVSASLREGVTGGGQ